MPKEEDVQKALGTARVYDIWFICQIQIIAYEPANIAVEGISPEDAVSRLKKFLKTQKGKEYIINNLGIDDDEKVQLTFGNLPYKYGHQSKIPKTEFVILADVNKANTDDLLDTDLYTPDIEI